MCMFLLLAAFVILAIPISAEESQWNLEDASDEITYHTGSDKQITGQQAENAQSKRIQARRGYSGHVSLGGFSLYRSGYYQHPNVSFTLYPTGSKYDFIGVDLHIEIIAGGRTIYEVYDTSPSGPGVDWCDRVSENRPYLDSWEDIPVGTNCTLYVSVNGNRRLMGSVQISGSPYYPPNSPPVLHSVTSTKVGVGNTTCTVNATDNDQYGIASYKRDNGAWQSSKTFTNVPDRKSVV